MAKLTILERIKNLTWYNLIEQLQEILPNFNKRIEFLEEKSEGSNSGGVPEAPNDGFIYGRQNLSWEEIAITTPNLDQVVTAGNIVTGDKHIEIQGVPSKAILYPHVIGIEDNSGNQTVVASLSFSTYQFDGNSVYLDLNRTAGGQAKFKFPEKAESLGSSFYTLATIEDTSNYVPYTGATSNIVLDSKTIFSNQGTLQSRVSGTGIGTSDSDSGLGTNIEFVQIKFNKLKAGDTFGNVATLLPFSGFETAPDGTNLQFYLPNKPNGEHTLATTDDIIPSGINTVLGIGNQANAKSLIFNNTPFDSSLLQLGSSSMVMTGSGTNMTLVTKDYFESNDSLRYGRLMPDRVRSINSSFQGVDLVFPASSSTLFEINLQAKNGTVMLQEDFLTLLETTRTKGVSTIVLDGVASVYSIPHGLGQNPSIAFANLIDSLNFENFRVTWNTTNIVLTYNTPPAAETIMVSWIALK